MKGEMEEKRKEEKGWRRNRGEVERERGDGRGIRGKGGWKEKRQKVKREKKGEKMREKRGEEKGNTNFLNNQRSLPPKKHLSTHLQDPTTTTWPVVELVDIVPGAEERLALPVAPRRTHARVAGGGRGGRGGPEGHVGEKS